MSTPESLNPAPLTSLGDYSYKRVLEDDYSTGKLNLKFKASTNNGGTANYKGWLDVTNHQSKQETKFQFPYNSWFVQLATREDGAKVHVDFGQAHKFTNGGVNLFANAKLVSTNFNQTVVRVGAVTQLNSITNHLRFEYNPQGSIVNALSRTLWKSGPWTIVSAEDYQLTNFGVRRLDFIVGYAQPKYDIFLRHLTDAPHKAKQISRLTNGNVSLDVVYRHNKLQYGAEATFNLANQAVSSVVGVATKVNNVDVKARVNFTKKFLGLSGKGKLNNKFNWALSTQVPIDGSTPTKQGVFPLPVGFTVETSL